MKDLLDEPKKLKNHLKPNYYVLYIWLALYIISFPYRIMHWPFSLPLMLLTSSAVLAYSSSKIIFITKLKDKTLLIIGSLAFLWLIYLLYGAMYKGGYPVNETGLTYYSFSFCFLFVLHSIINLVKLKKHKKQINQH